MSEIKIVYKDIDSAVEKLESLSSQISSRQLNVSFSESEGKVVDEILALAEKVKELGNNYSLFYTKMASALHAAGVEFDRVDSEEEASYLSKQ